MSDEDEEIVLAKWTEDNSDEEELLELKASTVADRADMTKEETIKQPPGEFCALKKAIVAAKADSKADVLEEETAKTPKLKCTKTSSETPRVECLKTDEPAKEWAVKHVFSDDSECKVVANINTPLLGERYSIQDAWP